MGSNSSNIIQPRGEPRRLKESCVLAPAKTIKLAEDLTEKLIRIYPARVVLHIYLIAAHSHTFPRKSPSFPYLYQVVFLPLLKLIYCLCPLYVKRGEAGDGAVPAGPGWQWLHPGASGTFHLKTFIIGKRATWEMISCQIRSASMRRI